MQEPPPAMCCPQSGPPFLRVRSGCSDQMTCNFDIALSYGIGQSGNSGSWALDQTWGGVFQTWGTLSPQRGGFCWGWGFKGPSQPSQAVQGKEG